MCTDFGTNRYLKFGRERVKNNILTTVNKNLTRTTYVNYIDNVWTEDDDGCVIHILYVDFYSYMHSI